MVAIFEIEIEIEIEIGKKCLLDAKSLRTDILLKDNFPQKVVQPFGIGVVIGVEFAEPPGDRLPVCLPGRSICLPFYYKDNFPRVAPGIALATAGER